MPLGAAVSWSTAGMDSRVGATFLRHFGQMTPENELKMNALQPAPGEFQFAVADSMVDWARANGKRVRGHTLVYGKQLPFWVAAGDWTRPALLSVMEQHIATVVGHFAGRIPEWDVVNEAIAPDGSYARNVWQRVIGPEYIERAFRAARAADPRARLFYNDTGIDEPDHPHTKAVLWLLAQLKHRGVPIDGVGIQGHVTTRFHSSEARLAETMRRFAALGLDVAITEMDVRADGGGSWAAVLNTQTRVYTDAARACRQQPRCTSFTTWGVSDRYSWLGAYAMPLLFDAAFQPKPALKPVVEWTRRP